MDHLSIFDSSKDIVYGLYRPVSVQNIVIYSGRVKSIDMVLIFLIGSEV